MYLLVSWGVLYLVAFFRMCLVLVSGSSRLSLVILVNDIAYAEGGVSRLFDGCFWRTVNICGTVWIANECLHRLPPIMFGKEY